MPPNSSLATNVNTHMSGIQPHPLEHELIRPTPVNHLASVAAAAVASHAASCSNASSTPHVQNSSLNALQRSSNTSTPNPSAGGSLSAGTPLSNGGVMNSSSPKVNIPVDPAPRKASQTTLNSVSFLYKILIEFELVFLIIIKNEGIMYQNEYRDVSMQF